MSSKVLIVSQRRRPDGRGRKPGFASFSEGEDVLAGCTNADVVYTDADPTTGRVTAWRTYGRLVRRFFGPGVRPPGSSLLLPRSTEPGELADHYDVAVFVGYTIWDLPFLECIPRIRERADKVIAWFPEVWPSTFEDERLRWEPWNLLDAAFVGMKEAGPVLGEIAECGVHHLPPAVDVTRFAAPPDSHRPVDVLGIGRRDERLHAAMADWSRTNKRLYIYDTLSSPMVVDPVEHREYLGELYRRTNLAITNFAKYDMPELVGDLRETPARIWEGLAGGAIMVGRPPDESLQTELIGETVVVPLPTEPRPAMDLLIDLSRADHETQRRHQVQLALRSHDWVHRWATLFERSGLAVPRGVDVRIRQLAALADRLSDEAATGDAVNGRAAPDASAPLERL